MESAPLPDARPLNWVDRHAPQALKPWLKLGRFDRPIGIWLLLIPCWQGIALFYASSDTAFGEFGLWLVAAFAGGAVLMRAAGCAFNDVVDRDIDRQVARTADRPVAAGRISVKQALAFIAACCLISFLLLLTMNAVTLGLAMASLALVAAYPFMKRITWWPQAWLGLTFNWGALMGFAAAVGGLPAAAWLFVAQAQAVGDQIWMAERLAQYGHVSWPAALLYLGGVFWTLGYDTIYALQDIEDDAMVGVKSSARRLGRGVRTGVAVFYGLAVLMAAVAGMSAGLGPGFAVLLVTYAAHLAWQVARLRPDDPALALALFKSNREAGLILLAAITLGAVHPWS